MSSYQRDLEHWAIHELKAKISGGYAVLKAPCHKDDHMSGQLNLETGYFHCHACNDGCWSDQLAELYGLPAPPTKPGRDDGEQAPRAQTSEYVYTDAAGNPLYRGMKKSIPGQKKSFWQERWDGNGWDDSKNCMDGVERVLYNLTELFESDGPVLFVEGEKDVHAAARLGYVATTTPQGAGKAAKVLDWSALRGREVLIIPDNDEPGRRHAKQVEEILTGVAAKVSILELPNLGDGGDLSDWVQMGGDRTKLTELVCDKLNKATPDRRWIELHYLVSAWDDQKAAEQLSTFSVHHWKDPNCRKVAQAIGDLVKDGKPVEHCYIAEKLRERGELSAFAVVEQFESENLRRIYTGSNGPREQFAKAIQREKNRRFVEKLNREIEQGDPFQFIARAHEASGDMLVGATTKKHRTLKDVASIILKKIAEGESRETVYLPIFSDHIGEVGGGDVIPYCGPPKTGKSFLLRTIREGLAKAGIPTLTGQLELREDQVASREFTATLGIPEPDQLMAKRLLKENHFEHLANAYFTTTGNSIDTYKAEVWNILAAHPEVKVWFTDYNERIYEYRKNTDANLQAAAVASFIKDTAKRFNVVAIVLLQPNNRYYSEGHHGPRVDHADHGKKWSKDAQAMGFMHSPRRFDKESPEDLIEFWWLATRDAKPGVQRLRFEPERARFTIYDSLFRPISSRPKAVNEMRARVEDDDKFESIEDVEFDF